MWSLERDVPNPPGHHYQPQKCQENDAVDLASLSDLWPPRGSVPVGGQTWSDTFRWKHYGDLWTPPPSTSNCRWILRGSGWEKTHRRVGRESAHPVERQIIQRAMIGWANINEPMMLLEFSPHPVESGASQWHVYPVESTSIMAPFCLQLLQKLGHSIENGSPFRLHRLWQRYRYCTLPEIGALFHARIDHQFPH